MLCSIRPMRRWLLQPGPYVAFGRGFIWSSVRSFIWNAGHGWVSFLFQGGRAVGELDASTRLPAWWPILAQAGYLFPWIWVSLILILVAECRQLAGDRLGSRAALALPGGCPAGGLHRRGLFSPGLAALGVDRARVALSDSGEQVGGATRKTPAVDSPRCLPRAPASRC